MNTSRLLWVVGVALWFCGQVGAAERPGVVDDFRYADDGAAGAAWRPMGESAAARVGEVGGKRGLRLGCNFKDTRIERASWDREVRLDMTACRGLRFSVYCADRAPIGHFNLYLRSGDGWYSASFAVEKVGQWNTVTIRKERTQIEGRPGGWGEISAIRVSAWRGQAADAEMYLADMALEGGAADIAIIRNESAAEKSPGELRSVCDFTSAMAGQLDALGLEYSVLSDLDLSAPRLKGVKLAILPHSPAMADAAGDVLAEYVRGTGRVLAFYTLPEKVATAAGIALKGHMPQKSPGQYASIRMAEGVMTGAPQRVGQASWNIQAATAIEGRSRVVGQWLDRDGKDVGQPAIIAADRCIFMTHVLLADDAANKRRLLLAMVGQLLPDAWRVSAKRSIEQIGRFGSCQTMEQAREFILASGRVAAAEALATAEKHRAAAGEALASGKYLESTALAERAKAALSEAWCLAQKTVAGEHRAFWCHSAVGPRGMTWDESIRVLADNGFTAVLPNMLWGGSAFYDSKVLPVAADVAQRGDQIAACLAACKKYGVKCHVWKVNWNMGWSAPREFAERMKREGRTQRQFNGTAEDMWLCPSHPANQQLEIDAMVEVATKYDVDGIHFDYIRYPGKDSCFCPGCRERFEARIGAKVVNWPADVRRDAALGQKWLDFRRDSITHVVAEVSRIVRRERPKVQISAAVFPNWPADRDGVGQDWKLWCERGYLDFVCPMDYTASAGDFENLVRQQKQWAGKAPVYPGIGLSVWPTADVCQLIDFITLTRKLGTGGFTIFNYDAVEAKEVAPMCGKGITGRE